MRDSELVASIVAGDPEGLAAAYDKYAGDLYGYCRSLLQEPDDAADAVQDTFVIAASKLAGLRDPERLRAWLFAVARNECLHRLKSRHAASPLQDAPEPQDDSADVGVAAERAEIVALVRAAVAGLNDGERDVINQLWHGLEVPEVAAVLGVSRTYAYTLFSRARDQLEASVAVLLVGRVGRRDCAALDSLLGDWDGRLTARLRKRVGRHIDRCLVCSDRRRRELTPAMLYGLTPGALLAIATLRGLPALASTGHLGSAMSMARDAVLRLATHAGPHAAGYSAAVGRSAHSFGMSGFPKPPHHGHLGFIQLPHLPLATASGTAAAATATATVVVTAVVPPLGPIHASLGAPLMVSSPALATAPSARSGAGAGGQGASPAALPRFAASATALPGGIATGSPSPAVSRVPAATATPAVATPTAVPPTAVPPTAVPPTAQPSGSPAVPTPTAGEPTSAPTQTSTTGVPTSEPAGTPPPTATATVTPTPSDSPGEGTLAVSADTVVLSPLLGGSLTLTANGGPVSWSIAEPDSALGSLAVSLSSGTLDAGQSTTITLTLTQLVSLDTQLTVEPGDQPVTVLVELG
jgi:RNA polymerase sigma factor (sigma-70 family)